jgi:hypothetical protein
MPKRSRAVAELVGALERQLGLPAGANLYYTPAGEWMMAIINNPDF